MGNDNTELNILLKEKEEQLKCSLEKTQKFIRAIISAISLTIESRDLYISGHQQRVTDIACNIAKEMKLDEENIEGIKMAGLIHDIGKIYIPTEILSKQGKLTSAEFDMIKTHPQVGYNILKDIEFPWPIAQIIYQHHERINGSGYPQGLTGEKILIEAKIIAVADVVEAISSDRPYRPSLGLDKALAEIEMNKGILYDSLITDVCIKIFKEKGYKIKSC